MKLLWSTIAETDLEEIYAFYLMKDPFFAVKIHNLILDEVKRLEYWPEIGSLETWIQQGNVNYSFRSLVVKGGLFKVIYFIDGETVFISRIWNCRKNPKSFKPSFPLE